MQKKREGMKKRLEERKNERYRDLVIRKDENSGRYLLLVRVWRNENKPQKIKKNFFLNVPISHHGK